MEKNTEEIFTDICNEPKHKNELLFYCKDHNKLCCGLCIIKLKKDGYGQHTNCNVCLIENIKEEKKKKLDDNIEILENLSNTLEQSLNELKKIFEIINDNKEKIKLKVQKIFTRIRSSLNDREDEILLHIDNKFDELFFNENLIKESKRLPKAVKIHLEKGKLINNKWNENDKLNSLINDCIIIENDINDINFINEKITNCNSMSLNVKFCPEESGIDSFIQSIKSFGNIYYHNFKLKNNSNDYKITGVKNNIIINNKNEQWAMVQCENELEKEKEYIWKIKILKTKYNRIMVGVSPILGKYELNQINILDKFKPITKLDKENMI